LRENEDPIALFQLLDDPVKGSPVCLSAFDRNPAAKTDDRTGDGVPKQLIFG
jgi:hypothetical protein